MKWCYKCKKFRDKSEFHKDSGRPDGLCNVCKACRKANRGKALEYAKRVRDNRKNKIEELKTPCEKCGEDRPWVLVFHHVEPNEKAFNIPGNKCRKSSDILVEREKCICLCHNCHVEYHYFYGNVPEHPRTSLAEYLSSSHDYKARDSHANK